AGEVQFERTAVDRTFRSEGVAVGDINHDGKMDIFAGDVWYEAPDWKMHELRKVGTYKAAGGYSQCFANFAQDVNGDGWIDSLVIGFPGGPCYWYENPKNQPGHWKQRMVCKSACNETPVFVDLLGTGKPVLLFGTGGVMTWYSIPKDLEGLWDAHAVSEGKAPGTQNFSHGLGIGDINGDGRNDVLVTAGWWEAPEDRTKGPWTFHAARFGPNCADMHAHDFDGDGDNDLLTSSAHAYGIWWHEQVRTDKGVEFKQHEIFKDFSQAHAVHLVDMNGDGVKDFVTGKRWYAHNGKDPGGKEPAVLYWFEVRRPEKGKVEFIPHKIDDDSGVGTQFVVQDFNGDGKPDIVTSNKKGVHVFLQKAK
ncbi:MAG TPA: VCBS repeat-containing protein, partial [Phycisphaerae bacterium]|nr:VCBS repeat-containing protein [Phycisphaerae bacterium]